MNNDNQFTFEEDITLDSSVNNNNPEPTPEEIRKKILPALVIVVILLVGSIAFAIYYFTKDNRDKLICAGEDASSEMKIILYYNGEEVAKEMEVSTKMYFSYTSEKVYYESLKKKGSGYCDLYKSKANYCKEKIDNDSITITIRVNTNEFFMEDIEGKTISELKELIQNEYKLTCEYNKEPKIPKVKKIEMKDSGKEFIDNTMEKLVNSIESYIQAVTTAVNDNEFGSLSNPDNLYYIRVDYDKKKSCVALEKGGVDPFGNWEEAYVVVHYDPSLYSYNYYFTYYDDVDYGIPLTKADDIKKSMDIDNHIDSVNITKQTNGLLTENGEPVNIVVISPETNCLQPNE